MSRDRGDTPDPEPDAELLAAYVDGVAELSPEERHRIEARLARDPGARAEAAAVRGLLDQLRSLPPEGNEPDWAAMASALRDAAAAGSPRPWWRRWQWLVPTSTFATAALVLIATWSRPEAVTAPRPSVDRGHDPRPSDDVMTLWLGGTEVEVSASGALGVLGEVEPASPEADAEPDEVALLPSTDLAWVDTLDDAALDRAERWLAGSR